MAALSFVRDFYCSAKLKQHYNVEKKETDISVVNAIY